MDTVSPRCPIPVLLMLREPVARGYSAWNHLYRKYYPSFADQAKDDFACPVAFDAPWYCTIGNPAAICAIMRGVYIWAIQLIFQLYPEGQVMVISSERFFTQTERVINDVFKFLGLPPSENPLHIGYTRNTGAGHNSNYHGLQDLNPAVRKQYEEFYAPFNKQLFDELDKHEQSRLEFDGYKWEYNSEEK